MAWKEVSKYEIAWKHEQEQGMIRLHFKDKSEPVTKTNLSFANYSAMVDMLRNEKPINYFPNLAMLSTTQEPIGEKE